MLRTPLALGLPLSLAAEDPKPEGTAAPFPTLGLAPGRGTRTNDVAGPVANLIPPRLDDVVERIERKGERPGQCVEHRRAFEFELGMIEVALDGEGTACWPKIVRTNAGDGRFPLTPR